MKLRTRVRTLVATTLLFGGATSFAATLDYRFGKGQSILTTEVYSAYASGATIKVSADGSTTKTVSAALAAALTTKGVDGAPDNTSSTEVGVIGFQANGNDYFAIIQVEGHKDGVAGTIGMNDNKLGINGTTMNEVGESLTYKVIDILEADGTSVTDDGIVIEDAYKFNFVGIGNAKSSELPNIHFYINGRADALPLETTSPDFTGNTQDWSTTPVKKFRWRSAGSNVTNSIVGIQFETDALIVPSGSVEVDAFDTISDVYDAGFVGSAQTESAVAAALLSAYPYAQVSSQNAKEITAWTTSNYDAAVAGSYTFTATLAADFENGYEDTQAPSPSAPTVSVQVKPVTEITGYDAIAAPAAGSVQHQVFADEAAVAAALGSLTATENDVTVGASWASAPSFDPAVAGTYKFTGTPNSFPAGYVDNVGPQTVTVDVVVAKADYVTSSAQLDDAVLGAGGTVGFDAIFGDLTPASGKANGSVYIVLEDGKSGEALYKVDLEVTAADTDGATTVGTPAADPLRLGVGGSGTDAFIEATESLKIEVISVTSGGSNSTKLFGFNQLFIGNATGEKGFVTDKDSTQVNVLTPSATTIDFSDSNTFDGAIPTKSVQVIGVSGNGVVNNITFDFADPTLTPALGVDVRQTGSLVEWSAAQELGVKEYQLVNVETGEVEAVVTANGSNGYQVTVEDGVVVKLVVVDNSGRTQSFTPVDGNVLTVEYNLEKGWNLIATIGENSDLSALEAVTAGTMWAWDGEKYTASNAQDAFTGLWVYAPKAVNGVTVTARKAVDSVLTLQPGWTLAGPANNVSRPESVTAFSWSSDYEQVLTTYNALLQAEAYWFFVTEETDITLDVE